MAGTDCESFGASAISGSDLCVIHRNGPYTGLVAYTDGRAAVLAPDAGETPAFLSPDGRTRQELSPDGIDMALNRRMQGAEIGQCYRFNEQSNYALLPTAFNGRALVWNETHLREIYRLFGQPASSTGTAYLCSDRDSRGSLALNTARSRAMSLRAAVSNLQADRGSLDDLHYDALLASLRAAAGLPEPKSTWETLKDNWWLALLFGIQGPVQALNLLQWLRGLGRKDPPDDPPPTGGGGRNGRLSSESSGAREIAPETIQARSASNSAFWLTAGGLLAAGATLFFLRRAGGREAEVREGEGRTEVRDMTGRLDLPTARPAVREVNAGNGALNVFDLLGAQPAF
ncbi:MAG TPA: hypothetical protein VFX30_13515 [bacterium]|nr:hypothetical protein [bacterium]